MFIDAPLYVSFPHFLNADPSLINAVDGLSPEKDKHESFVKINSVSIERATILY